MICSLTEIASWSEWLEDHDVDGNIGRGVRWGLSMAAVIWAGLIVAAVSSC